MYVVDSSARKATITLTGEEVAVKFPCTYSVFGIKGDSMLLYPKSGMAQGDDGVYDTAEGDGSVIMCLHYQADTVYIKGTGSCVIWAGNSTLDNPFNSTGKGGGGSGGDNTHYKGTTTTAISNGSTTNPITIDGESYTAVFGDIVVYGYTEFVFDGSVWSEFGRPFDTVPTSGSANAVTSDGVYKYTAGQKEYVNNELKGEIFNFYTGEYKNVATGMGSHAEGAGNTASGNGSHAEGSNNTASGHMSHAEGLRNTVSGFGSHVEGDNTTADGYACHAEGYNTTASGRNSHAGGDSTIATAEASTVIGKYNIADGTEVSDPKHLFIIGNGTAENARSNILEVDTTSLNVNGDIQQNGVPLRATTTPTITASILGKVVQYVGTSDSNYKQGWNYVAVSDGAAEPTYSWQALMDTTPTSGSNNPVTSDGVYRRTPWERGSGGLGIVGGYNCSTNRSNSLAYGSYSQATNTQAIALGYGCKATQPNMTAVGMFNSPRTNDLFNIGNGSSTRNPSNIVEVDSTELNVNGDIKRDGVGIDDYTTTERKIGKWIDGSDLYQRTFEVTSTIHNDSQYYNNILGTSDSDINIVDFEGFIEFTDTDIVQRFSLHQSFGGSDFMLFFVNNSDLTSRIKFDTNYTLSRAVITIKYTKPSVQANALNTNIQQTEEPTDEMR